MKTTSVIRSTVLSVMLNCVTSSFLPIREPEGHFANFIVKNGNSVSEDGLIMNAALSWGKWQQDEKDVTTVNHIVFNRAQAAKFKASGRDGSPSGAEGTFEIHVGGKKIAVVEFNIPYWGDNELSIRKLDERYVCNQSGFTTDRSPTIKINCFKIAS